MGPYEILAPIGAGGMGQVYKARDTRLGRDVAIKVSSAEFSERFAREARSIAALNHPNICTLYDVGPNYLVMELIEGESPEGPLPLAAALHYARQIADALEAAHEKGIVHRDLKPANIKIKAGGVVKVLDFGLAKVAPAFAGEPDADESATFPLTVTQPGVIMGTPAYMSPEQARGQPFDKRADIWAFGVVLYEMLTGKRPFRGADLGETLAAVIKEEPRLDDIPADVQPLLRRCLEKDPKKRLRDIGDLDLLLDVGQAHGLLSRPVMDRSHIAVGALAMTVAALVLGFGWWRSTRPAPMRPLMSLSVVLDDNTPLARASLGGVQALSPDGARLALTLRGADGKVRLHTRLLNQSVVTPLTGTENAYSPFFSPDGQWIGFFADGKLKKIAVSGGSPVTLCDAPAPRGASWGDDGNIIVALALGGVSGLSRVPSAGGTPMPVTKLNPGEATHRWPQVLPGSQAVLLTVSNQTISYDDANIDVVSLKTGERKTVQRGGFSPHYLATSAGTGSTETGHLVYVHQSTLFAVPFDLGRLAVAGAPSPILEDVSSNGRAGGDFDFAGSPSGPGTFVYLAGRGPEGWPVSWLDSSGKTQPLHAPPGNYRTPRFSPDGKRLAFSIGNAQGADIWVKDLDRDTPSRLSFLPGMNVWPVWTPNGKNIVFQSQNAAAPGMYWIRSDGSGAAQRLSGDKEFFEFPYSFSPGGMRLAFSRRGIGGGADIFTARVEGDPGQPRLGKAELFLGTPFNEYFPAFSPDGRWLAYASNESGTFEVYVRPFPGPGGRWQISTGGGTAPVWSRDGRELLFATPALRVMAVGYTAKGDSFAAGKPRVWSETRLRDIAGFANYDLAPDGKRLAAMVADDEAGGQKLPNHLTVLLNFFDELRRRAPAGK